MRKEFRDDLRSDIELEAWKQRKPDHEYALLNKHNKYFVPFEFVGEPSSGSRWSKTDTYLSEFRKHNPSGLILSESELSYVVGNIASYDGRQYSEKDKQGQGFAHCLVIPKARVYNIVDPAACKDGCALIKEMKKHFEDFWNGNNRHRLLHQTYCVMYKRHTLAEKDIRGYDANKIVKDFWGIAKSFEKLTADDFTYGFHVYPYNSIGHLHMHVFPHRRTFRQWSTYEHDWKTVPLKAILDVESEDSKCLSRQRR